MDADKMNIEHRIAMVSPYPAPGKDHLKTSGLGHYTKNFLSGLSSEQKAKIIVLAEKEEGPERYVENGITVWRCWERGNFLLPWQIWRAIRQVRPELVHFQHEFFAFDGTKTIALFILLLLALRLARIKTVVTMHHVLELSTLDPDFVRGNGIYMPVSLVRAGVWLMTKLIVAFSTAIIVHEHSFKELLKKQFKSDVRKVNVIFHGAMGQPRRPKSQEEAKRLLGLEGKKVILFFGYLTRYKGLEILIESFRHVLPLDRNCILVIAGGETVRLASEWRYQSFLRSLYQMAREISPERIIFTGYVPDEEVPLYFSAADLFVLPYTISISSSGPLSLAIEYETPTIMSTVFAEVTKDHLALFERDPLSLAEKIKECLEEPQVYQAVRANCKNLKAERRWDVVAAKTWALYERL